MVNAIKDTLWSCYRLIEYDYTESVLAYYHCGSNLTQFNLCYYESVMCIVFFSVVSQCRINEIFLP